MLIRLLLAVTLTGSTWQTAHARLAYDGAQGEAGEQVKSATVLYLDGVVEFFTALRNYEAENFDESVKSYKEFLEQLVDSRQQFIDLLSRSEDLGLNSALGEADFEHVEIVRAEEILRAAGYEVPSTYEAIVLIALSEITKIIGTAEAVDWGSDLKETRIFSLNIMRAINQSIRIGLAVSAFLPNSGEQ